MGRHPNGRYCCTNNNVLMAKSAKRARFDSERFCIAGLGETSKRAPYTSVFYE